MCQIVLKSYSLIYHTLNKLLSGLKRFKNTLLTTINVLPSKNQALCEYCTLVSKLKHY